MAAESLNPQLALFGGECQALETARLFFAIMCKR